MLLLATLSGPVPAAPSAGGKKDAAPAAPAPIELHVGIPGLVYIGQPLTDLEKKFPAAKVVPFSGQDDAVSIRIAELGISCLAVGTPVDLKVASIGFNLDGDYQGVGEAPYRTTKGIGKGSTVNDVLEAYGQPADVLSEQPRGALRRRPAPDTPSTPKMYQYKNDAGTVMTFFLVQDNLVRRVVVNDLEPLDRHVVKGGAKK
jgi:hypothetical protein